MNDNGPDEPLLEDSKDDCKKRRSKTQVISGSLHASIQDVKKALNNHSNVQNSS